MDFLIIIMMVVGGTFLLFFIGFTIILPRWYRKAEANQALVRIGGLGQTIQDKIKIGFGSMWVYPIIHKLEILNLDIVSFSIERIHENGLICKDYIRADIKVTFFISINRTAEDVMHVVSTVGSERASNKETIESLFTAKFSEAIKSVGIQLDFEDLMKHRDEFKMQVLREIGQDLNGYSLDSMAIEYLEQTNIKHLDPNNILDAKGIEKIKKSLKQQQNE